MRVNQSAEMRGIVADRQRGVPDQYSGAEWRSSRARRGDTAAALPSWPKRWACWRKEQPFDAILVQLINRSPPNRSRRRRWI
ncbi:hypothetical protein M8494_11440 [Serratia ureilytica]